MKIRLVITFSSLVLLIAACSPMAAPTPTATLAPTALPTATSTPTLAPTSTPTLPPTATPNATATQAARITQEAQKRSADLKDELSAIGVSIDAGQLAYYQTVPQTIELTDHNEALVDDFLSAESLQASDFVLQTDITWKTPGVATCGLIFRSEPSLTAGAQYLFQILRLSGLPGWDIEYNKDNRWQNSPVRLKTSSALDQSDGAKNHIVLTAEGNKFTVYFNGVRQGSYYDDSKQRLDGKFGFFAWQDAGDTTCTFENTAVWVYK